VVWLLAAVSFVGYALRTNITIAQEYMAPALGLTMGQMGFISAWGFQLAYAIWQVPAGFLGDRLGARVTLGVAILGWAVASLASGLVPGSGMQALVWLFLARVLLGASQAATYPVSAMAAAQFVPAEVRVRASAIYLSAGALGMALAPLTLAPLMVAAGWRAVFVVSAGVGLLTALAWARLAPRHVQADATSAPVGRQLRTALRLLRRPPLLILSTSYLLHSAVFFVFAFWFFRYLTEARGFSVLSSGVWGSVPHFMAFALAPLVGSLADRLGQRLPPPLARRRVAMTCLTVAATFVLIGANLPTPWLAIVALGVTVSCLVSVEAPYWTTATSLGADAPGAAGGVLNLMGNLGGVLSIWLVPLMTRAWGWAVVLSVWAGVALVASLLWLLVRVPVEGSAQSVESAAD